MSQQHPQCLYIEDEELLRRGGLAALEKRFPSVQFISAASASEAVAADKKHGRADWILTDFNLGDHFCLDFLTYLGDKTPVAIYSRSALNHIQKVADQQSIKVPDEHILIIEKGAVRLVDAAAELMKRFPHRPRPSPAQHVVKLACRA